MNLQELNFEKLPVAVSLILKEVEEIKRMLLNSKPSAQPDTKRMSTNEAIKFIMEQGFPMSKSKLYKLTSERKIPYDKFGIRVLFRQDNILEWIESQINLSMKLESKNVMILANSARSKKNKNN
jgi:excisionase family DNA binding protein